MRVIYFGTPAFAVPALAALIASRHQVVAVVTQPDRARGRGQHVTFSPVKSLALEHALPVVQPPKLNNPDVLDELRRFGADIGVVAAYGKILPQAVLDIPARGLINVHASLLPRWRGAAPIHRAIQAGDAVSGVTIMRVVLALDAGPMLARVEVPVDDGMTSGALEARLAGDGAALLVKTLDRLEAGAVEEVPQDESRATYAPKLERADGQIDWTKSAREIHNQIRGVQPWPMASVLFRGKRLILRASRVSSVENVGNVRPGTIIGVSDEAIAIATGAGTLDVTELQPESRKPLSAREFASGFHPRAGETLDPVA